nr:hypothetical protein [uncultured Albidiferax sp.]
MTKFVVIGVLNKYIDPDAEYAKDFFAKYKKYTPGHADGIAGKLLNPGDVEGRNGGDHDGNNNVNLPFRISDEGFTAQRWIKHAKVGNVDSPDSEFPDVEFPYILRPQFCLIFNGRTEYSNHMMIFKPFYERYFSYVTTFLETEENI